MPSSFQPAPRRRAATCARAPPRQLRTQEAPCRKTSASHRALYGITRVDHEPSRTHAWRVTIQRQGKVHVGHFSDGVYGGKMKALGAAKQFRDETRREASAALAQGLLLHPPPQQPLGLRRRVVPRRGGGNREGRRRAALLDRPLSARTVADQAGQVFRRQVRLGGRVQACGEGPPRSAGDASPARSIPARTASAACRQSAARQYRAPRSRDTPRSPRPAARPA